MKYYPKDTLAHLMREPVSLPLDYSAARVPTVASSIALLRQGPKVHPEHAAMEFYARNHLLHLLRQEYGMLRPLPPECVTFVRDYYQRLSREARRMVAYLTMITMRESRHTNKESSAAATHSLMDSLRLEYGPEVVAFYSQCRGQDSGWVESYFLANPPNMLLGQMTRAHHAMFKFGEFSSAAFGGPPWEAISDCLVKAVCGETSLEVMVDTAFTLAHNGGPIFNKGIVYKGYSKSRLLAILDAQQQGKILDFILDPKVIGLVSKESFFSAPEPQLFPLMQAELQRMIDILGVQVAPYPLPKKKSKVAIHYAGNTIKLAPGISAKAGPRVET